MIALVEPLNIRYLVERPDLGCATLLAACRRAGRKARLVVGQSVYLDEVLSTFADEVWELVLSSGAEELAAAGFSPKARAQGGGPFTASLRELLDRVRSRRTMRDHLDVRAVHELRAVFLPIMALYAQACAQRPERTLAFVDWYLERILAEGPTCVGFAVNADLDPLTRTLAARVRAAGVTVVAGGAWTHGWDSARAVRAVRQGPFEAIVVGPGEESLPRLLEALDDDVAPDGIPNVVAVHGAEVLENELRPLRDLDGQPTPDFSDYDLDAFLPPVRVLPVRTSTGCAWGRCAFCAYPVNSFRSCVAQRPERAAETIAELSSRYDCRQFLLHDDELSPQRARDLSQALLARQVDVRIAAYARLERGFLDDGLLPQMRAAGFRTLYWGLESGNDRVLKLMRKGTTRARAAAVLEAAARAALSNHCFVLIGFPGETRSEADDTVAFLQEHAEAIDAIGLQAFVFSPDAPVGREPRRWGVKPRQDGSYEVEEGLTQDEAARLVLVISRRQRLGEPPMTSRRARLLQSAAGFAVGRQVFLSHGLLRAADAVARLAARPDDLYPVLAGGLDGGVWRPVDFGQTLTVGRLRPPAARRLGAAQARLVACGDGTRDAAQLVAAIASDGADSAADPALVDFLSGCLEDGTAVGFSEPLST